MVISAHALDDSAFNLRRQADSQFDIAQKAYRKAVREYGESLNGMPDDFKASACRKMSSALHDNRTQYDMEDLYNQMKYKKQVNLLVQYSTALGCQ